jgi:hypothetical protein
MTDQSLAIEKPNYARRKPTPLITDYSKRKGQMAELIFVLKALSMGFAVSKPYGDSEPYDLVVGERNRLLRIQVKSVFTSKRWGYTVAVARKRLRRHVKYTPDEIDFIVGYVVPHDAWYIIPVAEVVNLVHIRLYPEGARKKNGGYFEKYREAWHLLRLGTPTPTDRPWRF